MGQFEGADSARRRVGVAPASVPNSSISSRSGCIVAQLSATKGPLGAARPRMDHPRHHLLAAPAGPVISTRLPVGRHPLDLLAHWLAMR